VVVTGNPDPPGMDWFCARLSHLLGLHFFKSVRHVTSLDFFAYFYRIRFSPRRTSIQVKRFSYVDLWQDPLVDSYESCF